MKIVTDLPDNEKEILKAAFCGCGTVEDLIKDASALAEKTMSGKCLSWSIARHMLAEQMVANIMTMCSQGKYGNLGAALRTQAIMASLSTSVEKIMGVANNAIVKEINRMASENDHQHSSEGNTIN